MKLLLPVALLLSLTSCGPPTVDSLQVSARHDTWLETDMHWTGGFSGSQHNEYQVFYVRRGWWQDERKELLPRQRADKLELQQLDASTFAIIFNDAGYQTQFKYRVLRPWPDVERLYDSSPARKIF
jgi:hypothetical protein